MAEEDSTGAGPFDLQTIKYLVRLMSRHDLAEIDLHHGDQRIRLRRGPHSIVAAPQVTALPAVLPVATAEQVTPLPVAPPKPAAEPPTPAKHLTEIKSPTPGTFYAAANPDSEPYVHVGSKVQPNTPVCIIEAMKVMNEITAECTGTIVEILVENKQPVEWGTVLFRVDPTA